MEIYKVALIIIIVTIVGIALIAGTVLGGIFQDFIDMNDKNLKTKTYGSKENDIYNRRTNYKIKEDKVSWKVKILLFLGIAFFLILFIPIFRELFVAIFVLVILLVSSYFK